MDSAQRKEISKWGRDLIISVIIVPAILAYFEMSPLVIIAGGVASLTALATWERWEAIKTGRKAKIAVGLIYLMGAVGSGWWFFSSMKPPSSMTNIAEETSKLIPDSQTSSISTAPVAELDRNTLQSSEEKAVLRCDVPPPSDPTQFPRQYQESKEGLGAYGDALGLDISLSTIRGGVRIVYAASSDEGKLRLWRATGTTITKFTLEVRRVGQYELLTFVPERNDVAPEVARRIPIQGPNELLHKFEQTMESLISAPSGACHLI
jgi:hypothetical protein